MTSYVTPRHLAALAVLEERPQIQPDELAATGLFDEPRTTAV